MIRHRTGENILYWLIIESEPDSQARAILYSAWLYCRRMDREPNPYFEFSHPTGFVSVNGKELEKARKSA